MLVDVYRFPSVFPIPFSAPAQHPIVKATMKSVKRPFLKWEEIKHWKIALKCEEQRLKIVVKLMVGPPQTMLHGDRCGHHEAFFVGKKIHRT